MKNEEQKSLIGFVDINTIESNFFFETNSTLTEEEQKHLKEIQEEFTSSMVELHQEKLDEYKETVKQYLMKRDMIVKEVEMPLEVSLALGSLNL